MGMELPVILSIYRKPAVNLCHRFSEAFRQFIDKPRGLLFMVKHFHLKKVPVNLMIKTFYISNNHGNFDG